jgi:hypothetical protein
MADLRDDAVRAANPQGAELDRRRNAIDKDLQGFIDKAATGSQRCRGDMRRWGLIDLGLGLSATILAAVAGLAILSREELAVVGGLVALASAGCSGAYTYLGAAKRRENQARLLQGWILLSASAHRVQLFDLPSDVWLTGRARTDLQTLSSAKAALEAGDVDRIATMDRAPEPLPAPPA